MKRRFVIHSLAVLILGINIAALAGLLFVPGEKDTGPVRKSVEVGEFRLSLSSEHSVYSAAEMSSPSPLELAATLEYIGKEPVVSLVQGKGMPALVLCDSSGSPLISEYTSDIAEIVELRPGEVVRTVCTGEKELSKTKGTWLFRRGDYIAKATFAFAPIDRGEPVHKTLELEIEIR